MCAYTTWMKVQDQPCPYRHPLHLRRGTIHYAAAHAQSATCCKSSSTHPPAKERIGAPIRPPVAQVIYWALAGVWVAFFLVWLALVLSPGKRRRGLRLFLFVLPLVMFGNSVVQVELAKP